MSALYPYATALLTAGTVYFRRIDWTWRRDGQDSPTSAPLGVSEAVAKSVRKEIADWRTRLRIAEEAYKKGQWWEPIDCSRADLEAELEAARQELRDLEDEATEKALDRDSDLRLSLERYRIILRLRAEEMENIMKMCLIQGRR